MHVDKAGVQVAGDGEKIDAVDEQTNVPHIFAVGDVLYVNFVSSSCQFCTVIRLFAEKARIDPRSDPRG